MEPAKKQSTPSNVTVYRGPELIRKLKEVRGVAYYSSHKSTPTTQAMKKFHQSVAKIKDSDAVKNDPEQAKKMAMIVVVFIVLIFVAMNF